MVTATTLRLRAARPEVFGPSGTYAPVDGGDHVLGFIRGGAVLTLATRAAGATRGRRRVAGTGRCPYPR
jgi:(1->4)-alpha-D-glucan 1-alpha-D-glucosylmutase